MNDHVNATTASILDSFVPKENAHPSVPVQAVVGQCEDCEGTGWYGCDGPGIQGNTEFVKCDCGTAAKCTAGWHKYRLIDGMAWCDECGLEADLSVCKLTHPMPNIQLTNKQ